MFATESFLSSQVCGFLPLRRSTNASNWYLYVVHQTSPLPSNPASVNLYTFSTLVFLSGVVTVIEWYQVGCGKLSIATLPPSHSTVTLTRGIRGIIPMYGGIPRSQLKVASTSLGSDRVAVVPRSMLGTYPAGEEEGVWRLWAADNTEIGSDADRYRIQFKV